MADAICMEGAYKIMNVNKVKQAKDIIANATKDEQLLKDAVKDIINELENLERRMVEIVEVMHGNGQVQKENADVVESEADNIMMALAREQAKHDPEWAAMLKELDEFENQIAELTDVLGSV